MNKIKASLLALCLAVSMSVTAYAAENNAQPADVQQIQKAVTEFNSNKTEQGITTISKLIKEQPNHAQALFQRGKMYLVANQEAKAKADFDKVIDVEQDKALANYLVGEFYAEAGKLDLAMEYVNTAIGADAKFAPAYFVRSIVKQANQDATALADMNKVIELEPKYTQAYLARASMYLRANQPAQAEKDLNSAVSMVENKAQINYLVAQIYFGAQNMDKAIAHATSSINATASAPAYAMRANAYSSQKQYDKAVADLDKAIEMAPNAADLYMIRGVAQANLTKLDLALVDTNKAIELAPNLAMAYVNRGMINLGLNKQTDAKADFKKAISLNAKLAELVPAEFK